MRKDNAMYVAGLPLTSLTFSSGVVSLQDGTGVIAMHFAGGATRSHTQVRTFIHRDSSSERGGKHTTS